METPRQALARRLAADGSNEASPNPKKVCYRATQLLELLEGEGIELRGPLLDVRLMAALLAPMGHAGGAAGSPTDVPPTLAQLLVLAGHPLLVVVELSRKPSQLVEVVVAVALGQSQWIELFFDELGLCLCLRHDRILPALGGEVRIYRVMRAHFSAVAASGSTTSASSMISSSDSSSAAEAPSPEGADS